MPNFFTNSIKKTKQSYQLAIAKIQKRPMLSFFVVLGLLLLAIFASKTLSTPKIIETSKAVTPKEVQIYQVSSMPKVSFQGQVEKIGVIKIQSQTSAVVQKINVTEGQFVSKGTNLISLSTNYSGANAAGVQAQIAARQYQQITDTYSSQQDLINKQKDLSNTMRDNSSNLATISAQSKNETQSLIDLNQNILNSLNSNLADLKNNPPSPANDAAILQAQQAISGFQAGQNQLQSAFRNLDYSTNTGNEPQHLIDLQRDITVKQLELQEKGLEMNRDITKLQLTLANIGASFFRPSAPISGTIERIHVHPLDVVNPGTPLVTIVGKNKSLQLIVQVPANVAGELSQIEPATIHLNTSEQQLLPSFISSDATDGRLYSVVFNLPESAYNDVSDGDYVQVDLPIQTEQTQGIYFLPLDAVSQTQDQSVVYVEKNNKVVAKNITLGNVSGKFVQVTSGLSGIEKVILNRNVVNGDQVKPL